MQHHNVLRCLIAEPQVTNKAVLYPICVQVISVTASLLWHCIRLKQALLLMLHQPQSRDCTAYQAKDAAIWKEVWQLPKGLTLQKQAEIA